MRVVAFGLASAFAWGVADFLAGIESRRNAYHAVSAVAQAAGLVLVSLVLLAEGLPSPSGLVLGIGAAVGIFSGLGSTCFYQAMSTGTISVVAPIAAAGAAIPVLVSIARGELPSAFVTAGLVLTIAGVVLASRIPPREPVAHAADRRAIVLSLAGALCIGAFLLGLSAGASRSLIWTLWLQRFWALAVMLLTTRLATGSLRPRLDRLWPSLGVGVFNTGGPAFFAAATVAGSLSVAAVTSSLHSVITVVLAAFLLRERVVGLQRAGTVLAIAGVLVLSAND